MNFTYQLKRFSHWLHLWLGLVSGIVVFIVSFTGALYVFHTEIKDAMEPWRFVEPQQKAYVAPGVLLDTAAVYVENANATGLTYDGRGGAAAVGFWLNENGKRTFKAVFMNPYTAEFIHLGEPFAKKFDFFRFVMHGHRFLWLPEKIGKYVVGISVLIFLVLFLTGMVKWWPANFSKQQLKKSFSIKWKAGFSRLNHDLHNVLGFYSLLFALVFAITGLVWSFEWFGNGFYFLTSGGDIKTEHQHPHSDTLRAEQALPGKHAALDSAFYLALQNEPEPQRIYITPYPHDADDAIEVVFYQKKGKFYSHNEYFFDQYSLEPLRTPGDRYNEAGFAQKLEMANYDLHTGAIAGLPTKILAFFISLICVSLPITGFIYWWKRKRKQRSLSF